MARCYADAVRRLLPALTLVLAGCLGPNPRFDEELPAGASSTGEFDGDETLWETTGATEPGAEPGAAPGATSSSTTAQDSATTEVDGSTGEASSTGGELTTGGWGSTDDATTGGLAAQDCDPGDPRLAACWGFDDAGGEQVPDGSSNGNHGEVSGLELVDSPWGQALRGTPELVLSVPSSPSLESAGGLTVEMWVYLDALPEQGRMGLYENKGESSLFVDAVDGLDCRTNGLKVSGVEIEAAVWTHVACTIEDGTMRVFVDGELRAENTGPAPDVDLDKPVAIANSSMGWNDPLLGALDRVRVWSEALPESEICALADAPGC